jgi:ABC-type dipeptide/oligopeptide/nickel transport system ATPase subunit
MSRRRTAQEIEELLESYRTSGMTRIAYCQQVGIALSTLGRYLRQRSGGQRLVRVNVDGATEPRPSFVLVLSNGRRIESGWQFPDGDLARLIRVAEAQ